MREGRADRPRGRGEGAVAGEERYRRVFEGAPDPIFLMDARGEIEELNDAALVLLGRPADELLGQPIASLLADPAQRDRLETALESGAEVRALELGVERADGEVVWCVLSAWPRRDGEGTTAGWQAILHDISSRKGMEDQLVHDAFHDPLTELPNRALFMDRLERAVARRRRGEERDLAVLFLDLDRFKVVNDSLGHSVGDQLLQEMARLLESEVRDEDTVARIGGDEFAILLDGVDYAIAPTHVAERIQERLRQPFDLEGHNVFSSLSIGIAFGGAGSAAAAEEVLRNADTAMYRAKAQGPARYQIYDEGMHAHAVSLLQLETDLRLALERHELVLHYQPVIELATGRLIGFEALCRWQHPSRGLLHPQTFIPVAEETGLIVPLGEWVLRTAARQLRVWQEREARFRELFVAVNVSPEQLSRGDLRTLIGDVLDETGLPGRALRLELPESILVRAPDVSFEVLRALSELDVGLCLDDFGTGYSSLARLHDCPIDTLKIDRSIVARLDERGEGAEGRPRDFAETIVALARNLGLRTVAEGVETEEQLERLGELGMRSVQGFLFASPLDEQATASLLDDALASPPARSEPFARPIRASGRRGSSRTA